MIELYFKFKTMTRTLFYFIIFKLFFSYSLTVIGQENLITGNSIELNTPISGNTTIKAKENIIFKPGFKYTAATNSILKAFIDPGLIPNIVYNTPVKPFSTSFEVGSLPGSVDVSPTGAATYQIPIALPPGTAGMVPNLSIVYNSQAGDGMLGKGWTISGFSSIIRIPTNLHDDLEIDGVNFNEDDKFAIDGNRLIEINGNYGSDGTEYRTQSETFSRIFSYGSAGNGPEKFLVETKEGTFLEYGYTDDSRFTADGRTDVTLWLLNKITDKYGNYYKIAYFKNNKEYYPVRIEYTGNALAGLETYNTIKFYYGLRSDPSIGFVSGSAVTSTVILSEIVINCDGTDVNKYEFRYKEDFNSKLNEIIYYAGNKSLNSTKISWGDISNNFLNSPINGTVANSNLIAADFDGDGYSDIVQIKYDDYTVTGLDLYRNINGNNSISASFQNVFTLDINLRAEFFPGDFNGDGRTDLLYIKSRYNGPDLTTTYNIHLLISEGQSFSEVPSGIPYFTVGLGGKPIFNVGNFNGDGKTDWVMMCLSEQFDHTIHLYTFGTPDGTQTAYRFAYSDKFNLDFDQQKVADFNGDGKTDIMLINKPYGDYSCQILGYEEFIKTISGNGELILPRFELVLIEHGGFPTKDHRIFTGDFNGDGKTDVLTWVNNSSAWEIHYYGENDFIWTSFHEVPALISSIDPTDPAYYYSLIVLDCNGDGKDDIFERNYIVRDDNIWCDDRLFENKGTTFAVESNSSIVTNEIKANYTKLFDFRTRLDFNGDGKEDLLLAKFDNANQRNILFFRPNEQKNLVKSIINGFNVQTKFEYLNCTNNSVYISGSGNTIAQNVIEIKAAMPVVSKIYAPAGDGSANLNWTSYQYQGLKLHTRGKGLLGFEKVTSTDNFGNKRDMEFGYNPVFYNTYLKKQKAYGSSYPSETIIENNVVSLITATSKKRFFPYVDWKEDKDNFNNFTIKTDFTYDDYGNITIQEITHGSDGTTKTTNIYDYANTWCPSVLKKSTIDKSRTDASGISSRTTEYTYTPDKGILFTRIDDPSESTKITTTYNSNAIGLPTNISISSLNETTRNTTLVYDSKWRYVEEETNDNFLFTTKKSHDPKNGNVLTETNILNKTTTFNYDEFGNLMLTTLPDNNKITVTRGWTGGSPSNTLYFINETADGSPPVKTYYSHLGQKLLTETMGFNSTIFIKSEYNSKGQIFKEYEPSFSSSGGSATSYYYDGYGRIDYITSPVGTTDYSYGTGITTITDPSNKQSSKTINAYGDVTIAHDNGGNISYKYNSAGLPETITAPGGTTVSITYFFDGNKKSITDPDAGTIDYTYDAFGNLKTQIDSKGHNYTMFYDVLGRITSKQGPEGTTTYVYDIAPNGKGQIASITGFNGIIQSYEYDQYGRLLKSTELIDSKPFVYQYSYDGFGREDQITYPSGFATKSVYLNGYLSQIQKSDGTSIWKTETVNALGQIDQGQYGNGKKVNNYYDTYHRLTSINYEGYAVLGYNFDRTTGNLLGRNYNNSTRGITLSETFKYDALNRLDSATIGTNPSYLKMQYTSNGNIAFKNDAGIYQYNHATKLHAVTDITGNIGSIPSAEQNISYNGFNKVSEISEGVYKLQFTYGPDQQRRKTILTSNGSEVKTKYFSGAYEEEITAAGTRKIHYIAGGDGLAALFIIDNVNPAGKMYYTYTDHLGSIVAIANDAGTVIEEQSFDPWGRHRNPNNWSFENIPAFTLLDRGFTGHEHLPEFKLINMNGRMYDPILGRMLSPDHYVQAPDYTQNFNRYSYCFNNPLIYTDPDGEFIQYIIGGIMGAFSGAQIANARGVTGFGKVAYILGGALIGAGSAGIATNIAAGGGFMANTASMVAGSFSNSVGMHMLSGGMTDVNIGCGVFSYNASQNSLGIIGKPGNSLMQNIGYGFGLAANFSDIMAGFNGTDVDVHTKTDLKTKPDKYIGHIAITGDDINISVGPGEGAHLAEGWLKNKLMQMYGKTGWDTYSETGDPAIHLKLNNLNSKLLKKMSANLATETSVTIPAKVINGVEVLGAYNIPVYKNLLGTGIAKYGLIGNSCVSYVSRALWYSGLPNIGIHPYLLHASLIFRQTAIYNHSYFIGF